MKRNVKKINRKTCTIIVNHKCNLNCSYCYEQNKDDKEMSYSLANDIILKELSSVEKSDFFDEISFEFVGGEPLLSFEMISRVTESIWNEPKLVPYIFFATTNGTILTSKMKQWFEKNYKRFQLGLSLDGDRLSQNINRNSSYDSIDIDFFKKLWPEQPIQMTISPESIGNIYKDALHMLEIGMPYNMNLAYGKLWNDSNAKEYWDQLNKLADYYLNNDLMFIPRSLLLKFEYILKVDIDVTKYCGTGTHMIAYDIDGIEYPCLMFTPLVQDNKFCDVTFLLDNKKLIDTHCNNCFLLPICPTCYGFNHLERGDISIRDKSRCKMFIIQAIVSCRFQLERILVLNKYDSSEIIKESKILLKVKDLLAPIEDEFLTLY